MATSLWEKADALFLFVFSLSVVTASKKLSALRLDSEDEGGKKKKKKEEEESSAVAVVGQSARTR